MFLIPSLLGKKMQKTQDAYSDKLAEFTSCTKDTLNGYDVIYNYNIFAFIFRKYRKINRQTTERKFAADRLLAVNECFSDILSALSIIVIIFLSSILLWKGHITMGTLLALVQLSSAFVSPVVILMQNIPKLTSMKPILKQLADLKEMSEEPEDVSFLEKPLVFKTLTCRHLTFGYTDGQTVLSDLNLTLKAGKKYALLGDSGCGKSTLIRLLTGYSPNFTGEIAYDSRSVCSLSRQELSALTAVIHQNVFLFDTDILDNICLGKEYSEKDLQNALDGSGVSEFLPSLEQGLHTPVGENGQNLSGGQRQRIVVARALIRRTPILIIDEGTSAVDREAAYEIEKYLLGQKNLTVITITHHMLEELRPFYDHVFVMENGQLSSRTN